MPGTSLFETAPFQQQYGESVFPALVTGYAVDQQQGGITEWVKEHKAALLSELARTGAVLFRGFNIKDADDFDVFIAAFGMPSFTYKQSLSNAVRVNLTERVFTANEAPPEVGIYLHHELAQTPHYPSKLFFFCEIAADTMGETPLCRSDILLDRLKIEVPVFVHDCRDKGVCYSIVMPGIDDPTAGQGRSWKSTLDVDTRDGAEARLQALGYSWEWLDDGSLRTTTPPLDVIRQLGDGREAFFNQLIAAFRGWPDISHYGVHKLAFGDGTPLPDDAMARASHIADDIAFNVPWQPGDVALVDNYQVMHGRRPFTGKRRVLASFALDEG